MAVGIFSLLLAMLFVVLRQGLQAALRVDTKQQSQTALKKGEAQLLAELEQASLGSLSIQRVGPGDSYALWFLSPIYFESGQAQVARDSSGQIYFLDNILYYAVRPDQHAQVARGYDCATEPGDDGVTTPPNGDRYCPHKMLIRKAIYHTDSNGAASLLTSSEVLNGYCSRPAAYNISAMSGEPALDPSQPPKLVAPDILIFFPHLNGQELILDLASFRTREAEKLFRVGGSPLDASPLVVPHRLKLFPPN